MSDDTVYVVGKRKEAKARATVKEGNGKIKVNGGPVEVFTSEMNSLMIKEPLKIAGDLSNKVDIDVKVEGGGKVGQAEAVRQSIARGLVEFSDDQKLEEKMEDYDRNLLVRDPRTTETHKPPMSSKGPRKHKQRSKR
ncbi:MAG: 30S ribosomal protein S9 [Candidatus Aenigmatarchaeota archaeon]